MKKLSKLLLISGLAAVLSGCSSMKDEDMGMLAGAVVGGVVGNQFGGGSGQVLMTAGGAVGGAYLGREMAKKK